MSLWQGKRQEARVKRVWAILLFFTQIGFIVFTYLYGCKNASYYPLKYIVTHPLVEC
ncbi:MAG: hypothetical protein HEQ20_00650 [Aphanizomenon flos-aquae KM1D3_PB]|uniref:hypothetical protein n=1 Tax=Aphanizomenon flos-aquae TaxID=1176 RepID=UPI0013622039|nr:hypothetical protein [Aphanizomenon flos-aquae]QSV69518.1 MAG: hypothetical protein HEQ20_00650 [Aphanizomenon flos-aquae KM1D3_PB]